MMPMQTMQQLHMQAVQQQVPNQSQPPPQAQQQPPSQTQQTSQTPHLQNQQFLSAHAQPDQNQRNVIKQRESSLFNSYVYDFLKRSGAHETARTYLREGENLKIKTDGANSINGSGNSSSDNGPLPDADVPVQAPEGFLYEWWTVFWDIYSVKLNRQGTMEAQRYVAERRGNRMMGQIPTMNAYQNPQVVAQAAQAQAAQAVAVQHQQQMRMMQQIPQHPPQQAQQTSQQTVQQQPQQAPSQPSQPPQQPQQTPQQPQPQPSPANHQPQPFNNRQQIPNGVIDNNTNSDMLVTSPQRTNTLKVQQQRRPPMNMQLPQQVPRNATMLAIQQQQPQHPHQALQNNAQTQAVQSQTQNSQPIQSQGQQNSVVNSGQVQQQTASQVHMTPNQAQAQLNPGTKRGVEAQTINQSLSMQATSPNKRQKMEYSSAITGQRQQQPNQQQGQMMNSSMMLTTPVSNEIASPSPDLKNRQSHLSNVKKNNPQLQQIPRPQQQMTPMNKQHVNQQMAMVQNTVAHNDSEYLNHMNQIQNQLNKQITASNQTMQNISSFIPMHQGVRLPQNYIQNMQSMMIQRNKMPPNMLHLNDKPRNINELGQQMGRPLPAHLYMLPGHQIPAVGDVGPNNNSAQQLRKNEVKGAKNGKTTPTQSQPQVPNGNVSNVATIQQPVIGTNEVPNLNHLQNLQSQLQQPTQSSSTAPDGSLEMNMDEVNNYFPSVDGELAFDDYLNLEQFDEFSEDPLGSSSNAGPSNGN